MSSASEKKRYLCNRLMERLDPEKYIILRNKVWRCSPKGQYVIMLFGPSLLNGQLKELWLTYMSYYTPIEFERNTTKMPLSCHGFPLDIYLRCRGMESICLQFYKTYEQMCDEILVFFDEVLIPVLNILDDSLFSYIKFKREIQGMTKRNLPFFFQNEDIYETMLEYLSVGEEEEAKHTITDYLHRCIEKIRKEKDSPEPREDEISFWKEQESLSMRLLESLQLGRTEEFYCEIEKRRRLSESECKYAFPRLFK